MEAICLRSFGALSIPGPVESDCFRASSVELEAIDAFEPSIAFGMIEGSERWCSSVATLVRFAAGSSFLVTVCATSCVFRKTSCFICISIISFRFLSINFSFMLSSFLSPENLRDIVDGFSVESGFCDEFFSSFNSCVLLCKASLLLFSSDITSESLSSEVVCFGVDLSSSISSCIVEQSGSLGPNKKPPSGTLGNAFVALCSATLSMLSCVSGFSV
mmetsp:Transcript_40195/g.96980  ORF Transcript_40195/g.96980 Transcript_40195/m.96980 type:complete len:217 (+) Transcript_40195:2090-2740(+)